MGSAYIPGLKVTDYTELEIERRLPLQGKVVVEEGQKVAWNTVVASTFLPGKVELVNVSAKLGIAAEDVPSVMVKKEGEAVEKDELIAQSKGFFGFFKSNLTSPIKGTIESVSEASGLAVLRAPSVPVEITAYVDGYVERVLSDEGVIIKTKAAFIQGIFGIGLETAGELSLFCQKPDEVMDIAGLNDEHKGKILVGGSLVTSDFLRQAVKIGVKAVVVGGIADSDLAAFLGYDLGVAITGSEQVGLTLIITEGFGQIAMAQRTFELLRRHEGYWASVSGATQIRAGVIRPEIIIPKDIGPVQKADSSNVNQGLVI
ncbi:hypothetical protein IJT10_00765, partial [bacterium]|nr:hypothetical protein [bacterium]